MVVAMAGSLVDNWAVLLAALWALSSAGKMVDMWVDTMVGLMGELKVDH